MVLFKHCSHWDKMRMVNPLTCMVYFHFFEALNNDAVQMKNISRLHFYIKETGSMKGHEAQIV